MRIDFLYFRCGNINRLQVLSKIVTSDNSSLQFDAMYWATIVLSIIISLVGAIVTFASVVPLWINLVSRINGC